MSSHCSFFSPRSTCDSISTTVPDDRTRPPGRTLAVRVAMRVSRARWYSFLRRVFHYQNGPRSDLGSNPFDSGFWMGMELVGLVTQIVGILWTLFVSMDERAVWPMRIWLSGYGGGCGLSLLVLHGRYRLHRVAASNGEQQGMQGEEPRSTRLLNQCRTCLDLFFAIWFVMGNVWLFHAQLGSFHRAPKLHLLCIALLTWNAICYSFPFFLFVFLCCCVPLVSIMIGYNMNMGSLARGATDDQISKLTSWKFSQQFHDLENGKSDHHQTPECCICLGKYKENEEIRQLACLHIFHLKCVDQWLRITSCCPLCKQQI